MSADTAIVGAKGVHLMAEFSRCSPDKLRDIVGARQALLRAAELAQVKVLDICLHSFAGGGFSGVAVISESHISVHTWPELGYASMDFYSCGSHTNLQAGVDYLNDYLGAEYASYQSWDRGLEVSSGCIADQPAIYEMKVRSQDVVVRRK